MCINARTLKDLNCPLTITKNLYCDLKNLDILNPFRGCRSGKSVKCKLKARNTPAIKPGKCDILNRDIFFARARRKHGGVSPNVRISPKVCRF